MPFLDHGINDPAAAVHAAKRARSRQGSFQRPPAPLPQVNLPSGCLRGRARQSSLSLTRVVWRACPQDGDCSSWRLCLQPADKQPPTGTLSLAQAHTHHAVRSEEGTLALQCMS